MNKFCAAFFVSTSIKVEEIFGYRSSGNLVVGFSVTMFLKRMVQLVLRTAGMNIIIDLCRMLTCTTVDTEILE